MCYIACLEYPRTWNWTPEWDWGYGDCMKWISSSEIKERIWVKRWFLGWVIASMKSTKVQTLSAYCVASQDHASCKKVWHAHEHFFRIAKNGRLRIAVRCWKCWISATERFQVRCGLTDRQTHRQPDYSNPRCAYAPRVKNCRRAKYLVRKEHGRVQYEC